MTIRGGGRRITQEKNLIEGLRIENLETLLTRTDQTLTGSVQHKYVTIRSGENQKLKKNSYKQNR